MKFFSLFFTFLSLFFVTYGQDDVLISHRTTSSDVHEVRASLFFHYDTLCGGSKFVVLENKGQNLFQKKIEVKDKRIVAIEAFIYENSKDESFSNRTAWKDGLREASVAVETRKSPVKHVIYPLLEKKHKEGQKRLFCQIIDTTSYGSYSYATLYGDIFYCLLNKYGHFDNDSVQYYVKKYKEDIFFYYQNNTDLESLYCKGMFYVASGDKKLAKDIGERMKEWYPNTYLFYLFEKQIRVFLDIWLISDIYDFHAKYPYSAISDAGRIYGGFTPQKVSYKVALKALKYFEKNYGETLGWRNYKETAQIMAEYGYFTSNQEALDSAYFRIKEIFKAKENGLYVPDINDYYDRDEMFILQHYQAEFALNKGQHLEAMEVIRPQYDFYLSNFRLLGFMQNFISPSFLTKAKIHLALNEKDSALQVYTELIKLTQADSIFDKIKSTYLEIHGSDSAYKDYLKKNGIDKFYKEIKYAPEAGFKIYGTNETVSLSSLKGKIVVLNFWGTYCKPCIKEMPELNDLKMKFSQDPDVIFIAPTKDNAEKLKSFFKNKKFNYQIAYDANAVFDTFNANFIPVNMVINRKGEIVFEEAGAYQDTLLKLNRAIEEALYAR